MVLASARDGPFLPLRHPRQLRPVVPRHASHLVSKNVLGMGRPCDLGQVSYHTACVLQAAP
jgi:hypothetical protein